MQMRTWERCARGVALALALCTLTAGSAAAVTISYFNGPGRIGFDNSDLEPPLPLQFDVSGQRSVPGLSFQQNVSSVRFTGGGFSIRLAVSVQNRSGASLQNLLLLVQALGQPLAVDPSTPITLDLGGGSLTPLSIVHLAAGSGAPERFFAGFEIASLGNNQSYTAHLEYTVLGNLLAAPPTLGFTIGTQPTIIPEPASALLVGLGLVLLGARRRP